MKVLCNSFALVRLGLELEQGLRRERKASDSSRLRRDIRMVVF